MRSGGYRCGGTRLARPLVTGAHLASPLFLRLRARRAFGAVGGWGGSRRRRLVMIMTMMMGMMLSGLLRSGLVWSGLFRRLSGGRPSGMWSRLGPTWEASSGAMSGPPRGVPRPPTSAEGRRFSHFRSHGLVMASFESLFGGLPDQAPLEASSSQPDQAPASEFCFCCNQDRQEPTTGDGRRRGLFFPLPFLRRRSHRHSRNNSGNSRCAACVPLRQRRHQCDDMRSAAPSSAFRL